MRLRVYYLCISPTYFQNINFSFEIYNNDVMIPHFAANHTHKYTPTPSELATPQFPQFSLVCVFDG